MRRVGERVLIIAVVMNGKAIIAQHQAESGLFPRSASEAHGSPRWALSFSDHDDPSFESNV